jgi:hypothetical protein
MSKFVLDGCALGNEGCRLVVQTIRCLSNSFTHILISDCGVNGAQSVVIASLSEHRNLEKIQFRQGDVIKFF